MCGVVGSVGSTAGAEETGIRHALATPDLSTVVVGVASLGQLEEALAAFEAEPLPDAALAEVEACYDEGP